MSMRRGQLEIRAELNEISGPDGHERLEPQAMAVLEVLCAEPGRVWSRDELLDRAWGDRVVSDGTLSGVISRLRRALRGVGAQDIRIETRSKRGYRLVIEAPRKSYSRHWRWAAGAILLLVSLFLVGTLVVERSGPAGRFARIEFAIIAPDGTRAGGALRMVDGKEGVLNFREKLLISIRAIPLLLDRDGLRVKIEANNTSHWVAFEQVIAPGEQNRFWLSTPDGRQRYEIRYVARLVK